MKHKSFREIAWLMVPIIVLASIVPGARLVNHWRAERELKAPTRPHIQTFELRAPTTWEAYHGAKVGYTARWIVPRADAPFWMSHLQVNNAQGGLWESDKPSWQKITTANSNCVWDDETIHELRGGLNWKRAVGNGTSVQSKVVVWRQAQAKVKVNQASRTFTLKTRVTALPLTSLRHSNFCLKSVELQTSSGATGRTHRLIFRIKPLNSVAANSLYAGVSGDWKLRFKLSAKSTGLGFGGVRAEAPGKDGLIAAIMSVNENFGFSVSQKPLYAGGLLSINGGWPQRIHIELPQGFYDADGSNLPFTAKLAPLPQTQ